MSSLELKKNDDGGEVHPVETPGEPRRARTRGALLRSLSRSRSRGRSTTAQSGSEYGSADESAECSGSLKEKEAGEGGVFVVPAPVAAHPAPRCVKEGRKRKKSGASAASSSEEVTMEVGPSPECDPNIKRPREEEDDNDSIHSEPPSLPSQWTDMVVSPRGRGRPPTTWEHVGKAQAQADLKKLEIEALHAKAERDLVEGWTGDLKVTRSRQVLLSAEPAAAGGSGELPDPSSLSAADLRGQLQKSVAAIYKIASFKKGYKGGSIRVLKEVAAVISATGAELLGRTQTEESRRLLEANIRLSGEVEGLRRQLNELQGRVANMAGSMEPVPPSPPHSSILMEVIPSSPTRRNKRKSVEGGSSPPPHPLPNTGVVRGGGWEECSPANRLGGVGTGDGVPCDRRCEPGYGSLRGPLRGHRGASAPGEASSSNGGG